MHIVDRSGPIAAGLTGGFVSVLASRLALGYDSSHIEQTDEWFRHLATPQWAGFVLAFTAVLMVCFSHSRRWSKLPAVLAVAGPAIIAAPAFIPIAANQALSVTAFGGGLLLAATAVAVSCERMGQLGLMIGVLGAILFSGAIRSILPFDEFRYMQTLGPSHVGAAVHPIALVLAAVVVLAATARSGVGVGVGVPTMTKRVLGTTLSLPCVYLLLYVSLGSTLASPPLWIMSVILAGGATALAALAIDRHDRGVLWTGFAIAAATVSGLAWTDRSWWVLVIGVAVLAASTVWGNRIQHGWLGFAMLVLVTASGLLTGSQFDVIPTLAYAVVLPAAAGLCVSSHVPVGAASSVLGPTIPLSLTVFSVSAPAPPTSLYWSNGLAGLGDVSVVEVISPLPIGIVVATFAAIVAAIANSGHLSTRRKTSES